MAALSLNDLFKERAECRKTKFINRFTKGQPFERVKGEDIILDTQDADNKHIINLMLHNTSGQNIKSFMKQSKPRYLSGWPVSIKKRTPENKENCIFSHFTKTPEFGGGGGRADSSKNTKITESAAAIFTQAICRNYLCRFSEDELKAQYSRSLTPDVDFKDIMNISENWFISSRTTSIVLYKYFTSFLWPVKQLSFHRGSSLVKSIEDHYRKLNAKEGKFFNINKWSPADIWVTSPGFESIRSTLFDTQSLFEFNQQLRAAINNRQLIGISLKMVHMSATHKYVNHDRFIKKPKIEFKDYGLGTSFFNSMDCRLEFNLPGAGGNTGDIQFRINGSSFQGEISGLKARHGKVSYGPLIMIMKELGMGLDRSGALYGRTQPDNLELKRLIAKGDEGVMKTFYENYKSSNKSTEKLLSIDEFKEKLKTDKKSPEWIFSKYMSVALVAEILKVPVATRHMLITRIIAYAASESELSAPFIKLS